MQGFAGRNYGDYAWCGESDVCSLSIVILYGLENATYREYRELFMVNKRKLNKAIIYEQG